MILYGSFYFIRQLLLLAVPYCYLLFLDQVITEGRIEMLLPVFGAYLGLYGLQTAAEVLLKRQYQKILLYPVANGRRQMLDRLKQQPFYVLSEISLGERKRLVWEDPQKASCLKLGRLELLLQAVSMALTAAVLFCLQPYLAIPCLCMIPLSLFITGRVKKRSCRFYEILRKERAEYDDFLFYSLQSFKEIRADNLQRQMEKQFTGHWDRMGRAFIRTHFFWFINRNLIAFKDVVLTKMSLYLLGGILIIYGYSTVAVLLTFMEYFSSMMNTLLEMTDKFMELGEQEPSLKRMKKWQEANTGEKESRDPQEHIPEFTGLECRGVSYVYTKEGKESEQGEGGRVLADIGFCLQSGECLAVLGKSGCGKSTLARLLTGQLQPQKGEILYQGRPVSAYDEESFFSRVGIVMQDSYLFHLTIRENLMLGAREECTQEDLWEACERANLAEFIRRLPQGMDTLIGENGIRLSGGQRQRLVLARMFLHDPQVLILDEAFSNLDTENERQIFQRLLKEKRNRILIMITHREEVLQGLQEIQYLKL